jgi:hypothetical protein
MPRLLTRLTLIPLLVLVATAATASAQVCMGYPSFAAGDLRMTGQLGLSGDTKIIGGSFAFGEATGLFGGPSVDYVSFPAPADKSLVYTGTIGWSFDVADRGAVAVCPLVAVTYQDGPANLLSTGQRTDVSGKGFAAGASLGGDVALAPRVHLVPFLTVLFTSSTLDTVIADYVEIKSTTTSRYTAITLGVGVVWDKTWTLRPSLTIPAGLSGGSTTLGLTVSLNAGGAPDK